MRVNTPRELRVYFWTYLNTAVCDTNSIPSCPELRVLASMGKPDESHSSAVVVEYMRYLKNANQWSTLVCTSKPF